MKNLASFQKYNAKKATKFFQQANEKFDFYSKICLLFFSSLHLVLDMFDNAKSVN